MIHHYVLAIKKQQKKILALIIPIFTYGTIILPRLIVTILRVSKH